MGVKGILNKGEYMNQDKECMIKGCTRPGKIIGYIGDKPLIYCKMHEYYGSKVINGLLNSIREKKICEINLKIKHKILSRETPVFCESCGSKLIGLLDEFNEQIE